jgi:hypothetical protein
MVEMVQLRVAGALPRKCELECLHATLVDRTRSDVSVRRPMLKLVHYGRYGVFWPGPYVLKFGRWNVIRHGTSHEDTFCTLIVDSIIIVRYGMIACVYIILQHGKIAVDLVMDDAWVRIGILARQRDEPNQ